MMPSRRFVALLAAVLLALLAIGAVGVSAASFGGAGTQRAPDRSSSEQSPSGGSELLPAASDTVAGRVVAAVRPPRPGRNDGRWRLEFGFLTDSILASRGGDKQVAIEANRALLPSSRFLSEMTLRSRERTNNRRWLTSSPVEIELSGGGSVRGRVIARYGPNDAGDFRVEFGWLPEQALLDANGNTQAAVAADGAILPGGRYLKESLILRRSRGNTEEWLPSTSIEAPVTGAVKPPVVERVYCLPLESESLNPSGDAADATDSGINVRVGERIECWSTTTGDPPLRYAWSGGGSPATGNDQEFVTAFGSAGRRTVQLTVTNAGGSDRGEAVVQVVLQPPPQILSLDCQPSTPAPNETVTCAATASGGTPLRYSWRAPNGSPSARAAIEDGKIFQTAFASPGPQTITVEVMNSVDSASRPAAITVRQPVQQPMITSVTCARESSSGAPPAPLSAAPLLVAVNDSVVCQAVAAGSEPLRYEWSGGGNPATGEGPPTFSTTFRSPGSRTVRVTAINAAGSDSGSFLVTVAPRPEVDVSCTPSSPTVGESVTCTARVTGGDGASYAWSGGGSPPTGSASTFSTTFNSAGERTIALTITTAVDSASDRFPVTVEEGVEIEQITCTPLTPRVGDSVSCAARVSVGDVFFLWSGGTPEGNNDEQTFVTSFASPGLKYVTLAVWKWNPNGRDDDLVRINVVEDPRPPVVRSVTCTPSPVDANSAVSCTAELAGGRPTSYAWRADGGRPAAGGESTFSPTFSVSGRQTVRLTVRNGAGEGSGSTTVMVEGDGPTCTAIRDQSIWHWDYVDLYLGDYCQDRDGRRLRFTAVSSRPRDIFVSEPSGRRGRIEVDGQNDFGTATITVTATDPDGASTQTTFQVTVRRDGECGAIPEPDIVVVGAPGIRYDLDKYCRDVRYSNVRSTNPSVVTATLRGSQLTITFGRPGSGHIRFDWTGASGETRTYELTVGVNPY